LDALADCDDMPGELMAWCYGIVGPNKSMAKDVQVGAANPTAPGLNNDLVVERSRYRGFDDADLVVVGDTHCLHVSG
jgi:hypothetical protein